jgi:hypothetical protein
MIIVLYICQSCAEESSSYATFTWTGMSGKFDAAFPSLGLNPATPSGAHSQPCG